MVVLFEEWAAKAPERAAVVDGEGTVSYGELNAAADRLARLIEAGPGNAAGQGGGTGQGDAAGSGGGTSPSGAAGSGGAGSGGAGSGGGGSADGGTGGGPVGAGGGVKDGEVVAIVAGRTAGTMAGMLAAMKTGAAYLPLDPDYPAARIEVVLRDSGARTILVPGGLRERLPAFDGTVLELPAFGEGAAADGSPINGPVNGPVNGPLNDAENGPLNGPVTGPSTTLRMLL
ncbi:AMP-binding protein [Nonomuraea sp. NPDC049421]|uniref:AMP-binding protein n=1 Tax=Nonomuraea sp. NPDC049421 TaxID=3155275 RepID=UPI00343AAE7E